MQEVSLKIVTCDEDCTIRMFDFKSGGNISVLVLEHKPRQWVDLSLVQAYICCAGALFAECIVPQDAPLSTVVFTVCTYSWVIC